MKEIFSSPDFIAALTACLVGLLGALTAVFSTVKARQSVNKANAYKEEAVAKLEAEKIELQKTILEGSYLICPKCGEEIFLSQTEVHVKKCEK